MSKIFSKMFNESKYYLKLYLFVIFLNIFILQPTKVKGESMMPTLQDNDFVILSKIENTFNLDYDYGDIVVIDPRVERIRTFSDKFKDVGIISLFIDKSEINNSWIKRIIGKGNDTIEFKNGKVYCNGKRLNEPYINDLMVQEDAIYIVPKNHFFVMGDNRNHSSDSRMIGYVPIENIKGKMLFDVNNIFR